MANYGSHHEEFILNFHQVGEAVLRAAEEGPDAEIERQIHWDIQPPRIHRCLLVVHPVETEETMKFYFSML